MKKRMIAVFVGFIIAVVAAFCVILTCSKNIVYNDGVWNGVAEGRNADIEVSITISKGKIVEAKVVSEMETGFAKASIDEILEQAVKQGHMDSFDAVSGSTISSEATAMAVRDALSKASN